ARHGSTQEMRWPFAEWGAEVVFSGHDHTYERLLIDGIPYIVQGLGGASKYAFPTPPLPQTQYRYNDDYGATRVNATRTAITSAAATQRDPPTVPAPASCARKP